MIETIQAYATAGLPYGSPQELALWFDLFAAGWKRGRAGSLVHMAPGRSTIALETITVGPNKGQTRLTLKSNLPRLVHGEGSECFTLRPEDVWRGCQSSVVAAQAFAPWISTDLSDWKLGRADANLTFELADDDALSYVQAAGHALRQLDTDMQAHGDHSFRANVTQQEQLAVYSKTVQTGTRGPKDGHLVRMEERLFGRKARTVYGETLADLAQEGADMARNRMDKWLGQIGIMATENSVQAVARLLIRQGMDAPDAIKYAGAAQVIAVHGVQGLVDIGVPRATAYRWHKVLQAHLYGESGGVALTWDDVVYAVGESMRHESE